MEGLADLVANETPSSWLRDVFFFLCLPEGAGGMAWHGGGWSVRNERERKRGQELGIVPPSSGDPTFMASSESNDWILVVSQGSGGLEWGWG